MSKPEICEGQIKFAQDNHSESSSTMGEYLLVKQHGLIDEPYWTINTEGEEWSFDSIDELVETVQRAINALSEKKVEA